MSVAAHTGATSAAAAHQARIREEEERLATYNSDDLQGWEFKIVRSITKITGDKFRRLCDEEARNGWQLVEKFDDTRVRFKRPIERRSQDHHAEIDPYRTHYGISDTKFVLILLGSIFAVTGIIVAVAFAAATAR